MRLLADETCLEHRVPPGFPERPARLEALLRGLANCHEIERMTVASSPREGLLAAIGRVHSREYVERFQLACASGEEFLDTADNPLSRGTFVASLAAAGLAVAAADWLVGGTGRPAAASAGRPAVALTRPPGHHCEAESAMGFCYLNNAAIAAQRLRDRGLERVAIVDFDVHHGNGTQHIFEERADVFYASSHRFPFYPGTGAAQERGRGAGYGATLNVPLRAGSGDEEFLAAMDAILAAVEAFQPAALVVSAGFDAWREDPLGGLRVSEDGFRGAGEGLGRLAARACQGRLAVVLEGGYDVTALPRLLDAFLGGVARHSG